MAEAQEPFWRGKTLGDLSAVEWEALCDGCGKCCLLKLEDADTGKIETTAVACKLLDIGTCRCSDYGRRKRRVPDCIPLTPENVPMIGWLPSTCAYRLVHEGRDLYWWHPLVSGDADSVHRAGMSVRHKVLSEKEAGGPSKLPNYVVDWNL
ncbi:MAG: YcgN family cysteine cluster protein [Alphaproteobacteria bacterium]|nr:YcgN family cysteine cluster protein [Alphaproteobacteria bacterium]